MGLPWSSLEPALEASQVTAWTLRRAGVCKGKSANTPGFLLAVLKAEGLVEAVEGGHRKADPGPFLAAMEALVAAGLDYRLEPTSRQAIVQTILTMLNSRCRSGRSHQTIMSVHPISLMCISPIGHNARSTEAIELPCFER